MRKYVNYHKHDHISSFLTPDTHIKAEEYVKRAVELGDTMYFTTNHGTGGDIFEAKTLCDKYGLRCMFGIEGYIVANPLEKDKSNYHIILIPRTDEARKKLNYVNSHAHIDGYYYKPRIFIDDLLALDKNDIYLSTACVAGIAKTDDSIEHILEPLIKHFGQNMFVEVQAHNIDMQKQHNIKCLELAKKYGLKLIAATDSHYIYPEQAVERKAYLEGKGLNYGDEDDFLLDYPDGDTLYQRFVEQGVLSPQQIDEAMNNTLIFEDCEDIKLDKEIKMPTIYPNLTPDERVEELRKHVYKAFEKTCVEESISEADKSKYIAEIEEEMQVVADTKSINTADYFLFNEKNTDLAVNKYGGVLTRTGRGCFTKDAIIYTQEEMKTIDNIIIGDKVLSDDGMWHNVIQTMSYDVCEDLVEFEYRRQGSSYKKYKNICTEDHKILVKKDGVTKYISANELVVGDLLCSPKIKDVGEKEIIIDLNDYNEFNYKFDNEYIYEVTNENNSFLYSPRDVEKRAKAIGKTLSQTFCKRVRNQKANPDDAKTKKRIETLLQVTPFKTVSNYQKYLSKHGFQYKKIPRYIKIDYLWNAFIGLMYADGWTQQSYGIALAVNHTSKSGFNRYVFEKIAERLGQPVYENVSKHKNLIQLFINSHIISNWFRKMFFESCKGVSKKFNSILFAQPIDQLRWIYIGMTKADGSVNLKENKFCYDSTSLSLISAYKTLHNIVGNSEPLAFDVRLSHIDKRGYKNCESYKIRGCYDGIRKKSLKIESDDKYWYLPVTKIIQHKNVKTMVYDFTVDGAHSYTINNILVHNSCGAFYLNKLLGMTQIDMLKSPVKLYASRFMSTARLLENKALPDIDFNVVAQEPFQKASKELLGEHGCYPMIAYGTMQDGEAFRNVCRSHGLAFDEFNDVAKNIEKYVDDEKWKPLIEESKQYVGAIVSASVHPCAHILDNKDLRYEYGVVRVGDNLCVMITSSEADEYKILKNDYLIVSVWKLISETFEAIGMPIMSIQQLDKALDNKTFELFKKGLTATLNQVDGDWATSLMKQYQITNVREGAMFTAALRPSFESWRDMFISRTKYDTGCPQFDEVLRETGSFILFQENLMQYFEWLGVSPAESIGLIKKISKKKIKPEDFSKLENRLHENWVKQVGNDDKFQDIWNLVQSCMSYGFAAPHAVATAYDMLYGAYLKSHYPLEYYTVCFNNYGSDEDKTASLTGELASFNIILSPIKFRHSSDSYTCDKSTNTIYKSVSSVKFLNSAVAKALYDMRDQHFDSFIDFLKVNPCNTRQTEILIRLDFFSEFGKSAKLLAIHDLFQKFFSRKDGDYVSKKSIKKTAIEPFSIEQLNQLCTKETATAYQFDDLTPLIAEYTSIINDEDITPVEKIEAQLEYLGYIAATGREEDRRIGYVRAVYPCKRKSDNKTWAYKVSVTFLGKGKDSDLTIYKARYDKCKLQKGDIFYADSVSPKDYRGRRYWYLMDYKKI